MLVWSKFEPQNSSEVRSEKLALETEEIHVRLFLSIDVAGMICRFQSTLDSFEPAERKLPEPFSRATFVHPPVINDY